MNRLRFLIVPLYLFLAIAAYGQISVPYEKFELPNGLTVIMHEDHATPTVSVNVWYHVGSAREKPGRTGFAHLFEHIMFEGSKNVPPGKFDEWLEAAGGDNNGSTTNDRTNYWENIPSNALEMALFLESDRMGFLIESMSPARVDQQRDVVKNERRQSYENRPYGMSSLMIEENLFAPDHPYHWPVIGSMEDLSAASYQDVVDFFTKYYSPANASLAIAGDIDPVKTKELVKKWFSDVPKRPSVPPMEIPSASLTEEKRLVMEDKVQLPRLYITWISPRHFAPGDAELDVLSGVLSSGKNSRLYKRLVYDLQVAQDVSANQDSRGIASEFSIAVTARAGHTLGEIEKLVWEEIDKIKNEPPADREVQRVVNQVEAGYLDRLERVGGFGGKADQLNEYFTTTGDPDYFNKDLARYKAIAPKDIQTITKTYLQPNACVVLSVVPQGKTDLAAPAKKEGK